MTRRSLTLGLLPLLLLSATGCEIESKHPLYTQNDLVFDTLLLGDWKGKDGKNAATIKKVDETTYAFTWQGEKESFKLCLLKLSDHYFLNFALENGTHMFVKVSVLGNQLRTHYLDHDWVRQLVERDPDAIKHDTELTRTPYKDKGVKREINTKRIRLTASPRDLQAFVLKHINDPLAFRASGDVHERGQKIEITAEGLASKKQRTFDYWYEVRSILLGTPRPPKGANARQLAKTLSDVSKEIADLPTLGVDEDAVDCGNDLSQHLGQVANFLKNSQSGDRALEAIIRGVAGDLFGVAIEVAKEQRDLANRTQQVDEKMQRARAKLTARYEMEFSKIK